METSKKEIETIRDKVLSEWDKGNLVFADTEGLKSIKFEDFIKQPINCMLYDINRDTAAILSSIDSPKWVNDFALTKILEYYFNKCKEYEKRSRLNDNEVREVAEMQKKIDSYEGFIRAAYMMAISGKIVNYPLFDGTDFTEEMNFIWRFIRDNTKQ